MCGAINPTKPITPVKLMIVAVMSTATSPAIVLSRAGFTPRLRAVSSSLTAITFSGSA